MDEMIYTILILEIVLFCIVCAFVYKKVKDLYSVTDSTFHKTEEQKDKKDDIIHTTSVIILFSSFIMIIFICVPILILKTQYLINREFFIPFMLIQHTFGLAFLLLFVYVLILALFSLCCLFFFSVAKKEVTKKVDSIQEKKEGKIK